MDRIEKQQDVLRTYHFKKLFESNSEILYEKPIPFDAIDSGNSIRVCIYKDYEKKKKVDPKATSYVLFYIFDGDRTLRSAEVDVEKIDRLVETLLLQLGAIEDESI